LIESPDLRQIRRHYRTVARQLSLRGLPSSLKSLPAPRVVIDVPYHLRR